MHLLTTLLVAALSPILAAAPAAPLGCPASKRAEPYPQADPQEQGEQRERDDPPEVLAEGRLVLRADGPREHGPTFDDADALPETPEVAPALRSRRLPPAVPHRPPLLATPRADLRAGRVGLPPPVA